MLLCCIFRIHKCKILTQHLFGQDFRNVLYLRPLYTHVIGPGGMGLCSGGIWVHVKREYEWWCDGTQYVACLWETRLASVGQHKC